MNYKDLIDYIAKYNMKIELLYSDLAKKLGISYYTLIVLYILKDNGPCTQKEIADKWLIPKQTVNTVIRDLIKKDFIKLEQGRNLKEKLVFFTSKGESYAKDIVDIAKKVETKAFSSLTYDECKHIANGIQKFTKAFEEELKNYGK